MLRMFSQRDILFEDNHLLIVNKKAGQLVQTDLSGGLSLEEEVKQFIKIRDQKSGNVFLGVVHRIDRPVSGAVLFAKSNKALVRLNEEIKNRRIKKLYWAVTEKAPDPLEGELTHYIVRNAKLNRSHAFDSPKKEAKEAVLRYRVSGASTCYTLLEIELVTGRHHQIRAQLSKIGTPIKGDLKYGSSRSNKDGSICLHSREISFIHPVKKELIAVTAPTPPENNLWRFFEESQSNR